VLGIETRLTLGQAGPLPQNGVADERRVFLHQGLRPALA
jgi:hypothetical protein